MDFAHDADTEELIGRLRTFMADHVIPHDPAWRDAAERGQFPLPLMEELKARAQAEGLWNLFLPELPDDQPGHGVSNVAYAAAAEAMGRVPWSSEVFNCSPPDSVNAEILHRFGSAQQRRAWLDRLLSGTIRSGVSMSEPHVPSSDPGSLRTTIERDGDELVVEGRKWFTNGVLHPNFAFTTVFSTTNPDAHPGEQHSWVIVPIDTPGVEVGRHTAIMGQPWPTGYCEVHFDRARVPAENLVGEPGSGLAVAAVLGRAVLHHCMRTLGQSELALDLMTQRARERHPSGRPLADRDTIRDSIARSRIEIDQTRLLVLRAAWMTDTEGDQAAQLPISQAKVAAAQLQTTVVDRAIQVFGAAGLTADTPLAYLWTWGRALHIIDGPDELQLNAIADHELNQTGTAI